MDYKYLYIMFPKKEIRTSFITQVILTFGLTLDSISELLNSDKDYLFDKLSDGNQFYRSLIKTFNHTLKDQEKAKEKFVSYFNSLKETHQNRDKEKMRELLRVINDKDAAILMKEKKQYDHLTDNDILVILRDQLKYMLTVSEISKIFDCDRGNYRERVKRLESEYPELVAEYNELVYVNGLPYKKRGK